jgi:hypothetical protein
MKKLLLLKKITFLFMLALLFSGPLSAQTKLVFITDTAKMAQGPGEDVPNDTLISEQHIIDMFIEDGYDVTVMQFPPELSTADQSVIDMLNEPDLIYIGRPVPSVTFQDPHKTAWNELIAPIVTENMWALRNSRMNWFNTTNISSDAAVEDSAIINAMLEDPDDEVFDGLEDLFEDLDITDSIPFWYGQWDCINPDDPGNGTVMAVLAGGEPCWVRFLDGDEFYSGSLDYPEGERVYFGLGHDNSSQPPQFYSRLTEVSKEIFLREAARLSGHDRGGTGVKEVNYGAVASKVYFNPVTQNLVVEMVNLNKVEVLDITGKLVYTALAKSNKLFVDLGFVESGIYLVRLIDNNNKISINKIKK